MRRRDPKRALPGGCAMRSEPSRRGSGSAGVGERSEPSGGPGGRPPGRYCEPRRRRPEGPTSMERRRVATGANHPASHSSAFRRGPGTPAGAPTGDQSTAMHVTPKPPLVRQDRIKADLATHTRLAGRSALSLLLFRACFLAKRAGWLRPGRRRLGRGPPSRPSGCVRGDVACRQPRFVGPKTSGASGLTAAVGDHHGEIGDGDSTDCGNRRPPAGARHEQGNRGRKTSDPDSHHDQVAALP